MCFYIEGFIKLLLMSYFFLKVNMDLNAIQHNISAAYGDNSLIGESLTLPLKYCFRGYRYTFSSSPENSHLTQRICNVFTKGLSFLTSTVGLAPSLALTAIGMGSKLAHLYGTFDQKVCDHLPWILKIFSRTGDRTVSYLNAKILSEELAIPFCFTPFKGCEMFQFNRIEANRGPNYYRKVVHLKTREQIDALRGADKTASALYLLPFYPHERNVAAETSGSSYIPYTTDWQGHRGRVRELLHVENAELIDIPRDCYSIALHIRDGGRVDDNNTKTLHPLKLPCMSFYTEELRKVLIAKRDAGETNFFIHIFTDAENPSEISAKIIEEIRDVPGVRYRVQYAPREVVTLKNDAGNMHRFQCMIRADSNLSGPIVQGSEVTELDIFPSGFDIVPNNNQILITQVKKVQRALHPGGADQPVLERVRYSKQMEGWLPMRFNRFFHDYYGVFRVASAV